MSTLMSKYPSLEYDCLLQIQRCIEIGLSCVETDQGKRPSARQILVEMCSGESSYGVDDQVQLATYDKCQVSMLFHIDLI